MDQRKSRNSDRTGVPEPSGAAFDARVRELDMIQSLARRSAEARTPGELFAGAVSVLQRSEEVDVALAAFRVDGAPEIRAYLSRPVDPACLRDLAGRAAGLLAWDRSSLPEPELSETEQFDAGRGVRRDFRESDLITLPVLRRDEPVACLLVLPASHADEGELRLLYTASNQLSLHLDRILSVREVEADRFRTILESMPQAVVLADEQFRLAQANPAARRLWKRLGLSTSGGLPPFLARLGIEEPVEAVRSGARDVADVQITHEDRVLTLTVSPLAGDAPGGRGVVLVLADITERSRMQRQLAQSERMSSLGQMISGVAHELNNPLASILGYAQLVAAKTDDPGIARRLGVLHREAERCRRIVENLLSFARRRDPERRPLSLNEVVRSVLGLMGYQLRVNGIEVRTELDPDLPAVRGDVHQLQQVLVNLLTNAQHAILAVAEGGQVRVRTSMAANGDALLVVSDSGPGVPMEIRERVFDPFFTTKEEGKGTGLGLSLVYGIVAAHGGTIALESPDSGGASFRLALPVCRDERTAERESTGTTDTDAAPKGRVLVVEDEPSLAAVMREALEEDGHRVVVAREGSEALALAAAGRFDLVVSDLKMPGMSGERLVGELERARPELRRRLLLTTGDTVGPEAERFVKDRGLPLLRKPFDIDELRQAVRAGLARGAGDS